MLTVATRVKTIVFAVIAVLVIGYIGVYYADIGKYFGVRGYYVVSARLGDTGGLYPHAEVSYRGVKVGTVGGIDLTDSGAVARLHIDSSAPRIPEDSKAVVADRSAVGEQYLDLRPQRIGGPYLSDGDTISRGDISLPPQVTGVLTSLDEFVASVPKESFRTVVDELDKAFAGQGQNLQVLLDTSSDLTGAAIDHMPSTKILITHGRTVLDTQDAETDALVSFAHDADLLAKQLADSDTDLRKLITATPKAARQVLFLLRENQPSLSIVLANLLTLSDVADSRSSALEEALVKAPRAIAAGSTAINENGARFGMALTFFDPLPCTKGYAGTDRRNGLDTSSGEPWNTRARCTMPASSGVNVRGSANAPHPGLSDPAVPGVRSAASPSTGVAGVAGLPGLPDTPEGMRGLLGLSQGEG